MIFNGPDPGIDGALLFIDDMLISSKEELDETLSGRGRECDATIVLIQTKTTEGWNKKEINNFGVAIKNFFSDVPKFSMSEALSDVRSAFFGLFEYIGRIRGGKPSIFCTLVATDKQSEAQEIKSAFKIIESDLEELGYFKNVVCVPTDREALVALWQAAGGAVEAQIPTIGYAPFPNAPGIAASYVATVRIADFINKILSDDDGKMRQRIFDENVRDFIGFEGEVNEEIRSTVIDVEKQQRFGIMNNGVTVVSPDVRVQGNEIYLKDFQIVNGCQTSNVLFECKEQIGLEANLMIKVIHAKDPSLIEDIVRSTNRQSIVSDDQFLVTVECVKAVEKYFEARGQDEVHSLYFERRKNQYAGRQIPSIRIFDIKELARCVAATFLDRPDLASRYPNRLTGEMRQQVFDPFYDEEIFYTSAYSAYRLNLHIGNGRIDPKMSKMRWHLLMAMKYYLFGDESLNLKTKKVRPKCDALRKFASANTPEEMAALNELAQAIYSESITRDLLKGQSFALQVRSKAAGLNAMRS